MNSKKYLLGLTLSRFNLELSKAEALLCLKGYFEVEEFIFVDNHLFVFVTGLPDDILNCLNRLAFTKECFVTSCKDEWVLDLFDFCNDFGLRSGKNASFGVVPFCFKDKSQFIRKVACKVVDEGFAGKVYLSNPDVVVGGFEALRLFGVLIWSNKNGFNKRRVHLKPRPHPSGIDPKLARAMVNLASSKQEVFDPFCGAGGILEEVKLIGLKYLGTDISWKMINLARINLKSRDGLFKMSAFSWIEPVECIVTDLPYGKSSVLEGELFSLAEDFFEHFKNFTNKIVVCVPNSCDLVSVAKNQGWSLLYFFDVYIHGSLTRRIHVFER